MYMMLLAISCISFNVSIVSDPSSTTIISLSFFDSVKFIALSIASTSSCFGKLYVVMMKLIRGCGDVIFVLMIV